MHTKLKNLYTIRGYPQHLGGFLLILAVYFVLAFFGLDRQSLWEDEFYSVRRVAAPRPIWQDGHGFLYFALLRWWVRAGTSEFVARSLSVFLGGIAVCLTYAVGSTLFNRRVAMFGTTLLATSPFFIWYSQEARYVTLMLASTLLTMYAFHGVILHRRFRWWLAYGSTTLVAIFSFLSLLLLPLVQGLYLLASRANRPLLRKWVVCQVVVLVIFALWFVHGTHFWKAFVQAMDSSQQTVLHRHLFPFTGDFNDVRPVMIPYTFFALSVGFSLGPSPRELYADRSLAPLVPYVPMLFILTVLYGSLLLSGLAVLPRQRDSGTLLVLWIGVPILGAFGIAKLLDIFYDVRYVAMVLPAYVLLLAAGIVRFRRPQVQVMLLGAVLAVHGLALANYYFNPRYAREDTRAAAQLLESAVGPQDLVLVVGTVSSLPHYYKGNPPLVDFRMADGAGQPLTERLRKLSGDHDRLWLVQIRPWQTDRQGKVKAALDEAYALVQRHRFPGVDIYTYQVSR